MIHHTTLFHYSVIHKHMGIASPPLIQIGMLLTQGIMVHGQTRKSGHNAELYGTDNMQGRGWRQLGDLWRDMV